MVVSKNRPAESETPTQPDTFVGTAFYLKLQATIEVIFVSGWSVFIRQFQFNELDDHMSKLKKVQNVNKSAEETSEELYGKISMDAELNGKYTTQQVAAAMAEKKNSTKRNFKNWRKVGRTEYRKSLKKRSEGWYTRLQEKEYINDSDDYEVQDTQTICVSLGTSPKSILRSLSRGRNR